MTADIEMQTGPPPLRSPRLKLGLFVTGATARSRKAIDNLRRFCDQHLDGQYELEVVDLYRHPERAREAQVVAAPTLIRFVPAPRRLAIGDLSDSGALKSLLMVT